MSYYYDEQQRRADSYKKHVINKMILQYYQELYNNLEVQKISEISDNLGIKISKVTDFIDAYCDIPECNDNFPKITLLIMLCTKFHSDHKLYHIQQERFGKIINKRQVLKEVKIRNKRIKRK